jgi:hypothetical protein
MQLCFDRPRRSLFDRIASFCATIFDAWTWLDIACWIGWMIVGVVRIALFLLRLIFV